MRSWWISLSLVAISTFSGISRAQAPNPASIVLPNLTGSDDPKVITNGWKFFYFHSPAVTYEQAYADFRDCYRYLGTGTENIAVPTFAPWTEKSHTRKRDDAYGYGMAGDLIISAFAGPIYRQIQVTRLRRCMEPRGYKRYPMTERAWTDLTEKLSPLSIGKQAKLASGPTPSARPVTE